jgi:hypothetical protein
VRGGRGLGRAAGLQRRDTLCHAVHLPPASTWLPWRLPWPAPPDRFVDKGNDAATSAQLNNRQAVVFLAHNATLLAYLTASWELMRQLGMSMEPSRGRGRWAGAGGRPPARPDAAAAAPTARPARGSAAPVPRSARGAAALVTPPSPRGAPTAGTRMKSMQELAECVPCQPFVDMAALRLRHWAGEERGGQLRELVLGENAGLEALVLCNARCGGGRPCRAMVVGDRTGHECKAAR